MADEITPPGGLVKVKIKDGTTGSEHWVGQREGALIIVANVDSAIALTADADRFFFNYNRENYYLDIDATNNVKFVKSTSQEWTGDAPNNRVHAKGDTSKRLHLEGGTTLIVNATGSDAWFVS